MELLLEPGHLLAYQADCNDLYSLGYLANILFQRKLFRTHHNEFEMGALSPDAIDHDTPDRRSFHPTGFFKYVSALKRC